MACVERELTIVCNDLQCDRCDEFADVYDNHDYQGSPHVLTVMVTDAKEKDWVIMLHDEQQKIITKENIHQCLCEDCK